MAGNTVGSGGLFNFADRVQMETLNHRLKRSEVLTANIANAETPGYRALGYDFEKQLQDIAKDSGTPGSVGMKVSNPKHLMNAFTTMTGDIRPDVFVKPTESIGNDGNTVDMDREMAEMAENQILYRSAVETLNRKVGLMRYAINGGR